MGASTIFLCFTPIKNNQPFSRYSNLIEEILKDI
jgi:hypothetical protein